MASKKLADWIKSEKAKGRSEKELRDTLAEQGYEKKEIDEAIPLTKSKPKTGESKQETKKQKEKTEEPKSGKKELSKLTKEFFSKLIKKWWFWLALVLAVIFLVLMGALIGGMFIRAEFSPVRSQIIYAQDIDQPVPVSFVAKTAPPEVILESKEDEWYSSPVVFGDRLYYNAKMPHIDVPEDWGLYVLSSKLDGSDTKHLALPDTLQNPVVSPDGEKIAFLGQNSDAYILDLTKSTKAEYTEQEFWQFKDLANVWDSSGRRMALPDNSIVELGYGLTKITNNNLGSTPMDWSKNGRSIVFEHWNEDGSSEIYTKEVLDENMEIYSDILERETVLVDSVNKEGRRFQPSYGPNDEIIFITVDRGQKISLRSPSGTISFISFGGGLYGAPLHPQYSPDGSKIAFINAFDNQGSRFHSNIYVMDSDFNLDSLRKITDTESYKGNLVWLDNENLIYVDNLNLELDQPEISFGSLHKVNINEVVE